MNSGEERMKERSPALPAAAIAQSLRAARAARGWSREALAYHAGISWSAIAQIESGRRKNIRLSTLSSLAAALGISMDQLMTGTPRVDSPVFEHRLVTYGSDDEFCTAAASVLTDRLQKSESALAVLSSTQIELLRQTLGADARRIDLVDASRWYTSPGAALTKYRGYLTEKLGSGTSRLRILGDPVWAGRAAAEVKKWSRYESLVNLLFAGSPAVIVCAYDQRSSSARALKDAQRTHPTLGHAESAVANGSYLSPEEFLLLA
jgi:transcriptional regulator with XRE-family HTH domain